MALTQQRYYLKESLGSHRPLQLEPPTHPSQLFNAVKDLRSICAGYLGTDRTIACFFKLLNLCGLDKHSVYRERFWRAYLRSGYINQAWMVLAPNAETIAVHDLGIKPYQFGQLHKCRRIDEKHVVLMMRLDNLLIAEWSHIGKCRFWFQNNLKAPSLFRRSYKREQLIDYADYIQQHYFSAKGLWQKDAAAWMSAKAHIPAVISEMASPKT